MYVGCSIQICAFSHFRSLMRGSARPRGVILQFMIKKRILCDHCRGSGAASDSDIHKCPGCDGAGVKVVRQQIWPGMFAQSQVS